MSGRIGKEFDDIRLRKPCHDRLCQKEGGNKLNFAVLHIGAICSRFTNLALNFAVFTVAYEFCFFEANRGTLALR
jgi:hypothetical protein